MLERFHELQTAVQEGKVGPEDASTELTTMDVANLSNAEIDEIVNAEWITPDAIVEVSRRWLDLQHANLTRSKTSVFFNASCDKQKLLEYAQQWIHPSGEISTAVNSIITMLSTASFTRNFQNLANLGLAKVNSSSNNDGCPPKNALDENLAHHFQSHNRSNQWISFEFADFMLIKPTEYMIRSSENECGPSTWILEGSMDSTHWDELDHVTNDDQLKDPGSSGVYQITTTDKYYKYFRITQKGPNHKKTSALTIGFFDIGGSVLFRRDNFDN